jgi:4-hydroxyproline epimerase
MDLRVVDSHTGGEPTRLVVKGVPELGGDVHQRLAALRDEHDWIRTTLCLEPRGSGVAVGAAMFPPSREGCTVDLVFFNNEGYLGMCGHGTIGVLVSLAWMGDSEPGEVVFNTVAGPVRAELLDRNTARFVNAPAWRSQKGARVNVLGNGDLVGDVAYGGNWFFLASGHGMQVTASEIPALTEFTAKVMDALWDQGVTGDNGARIDHVELFGPPERPDADSKNFVLCPGKQYDRSPCGTGTCAKLACLYGDGALAEGEVWRQESIIGSLFECSFSLENGAMLPSVTGSAWVTGETVVLREPSDPYRNGIVV